MTVFGLYDAACPCLPPTISTSPSHQAQSAPLPVPSKSCQCLLGTVVQMLSFGLLLFDEHRHVTLKMCCGGSELKLVTQPCDDWVSHWSSTVYASLSHSVGMLDEINAFLKICAFLTNDVFNLWIYCNFAHSQIVASALIQKFSISQCTSILMLHLFAIIRCIRVKDCFFLWKFKFVIIWNGFLVVCTMFIWIHWI